jgi:hypothetical protein
VMPLPTLPARTLVAPCFVVDRPDALNRIKAKGKPTHH